MNLLFPFRRDEKHDIASAEGDALLEAKARLALSVLGAGPRSYGELKWRTNFGSQLQLVRHKNNTVELQALAEAYVQQALDKWLPGAQSSVTVLRVEDKIRFRVALQRGRAKATLELPVSQ